MASGGPLLRLARERPSGGRHIAAQARTEGAKDRNVPLTRAAAEAIEAWMLHGRPKIRGAAKSPWLFLALRGGRMYPDLLNGVVQTAAKKTGLEKHATCHTCATRSRRTS